MKILHLRLIGALICLIMPVGRGYPHGNIIRGFQAPRERPRRMSVYISDAKAAVAERNWTDVLS